MPKVSGLGWQKFIISQFLQVRDLGRAGSSGGCCLVRELDWGRMYFKAHSHDCWRDLVPVGCCCGYSLPCYVGLSTGQFATKQLAFLWRSEQESEKGWARQKPTLSFCNLTMKVAAHNFCQILFLKVLNVQSTAKGRGLQKGMNTRDRAL